MNHRSFHEANESVLVTDAEFHDGSDDWIIRTRKEGDESGGFGGT
ncbi:MAG TPA: hypothetical protein VI874_01555 [Candidatus Norongarragalinales archaeon]|nr:hypothetical protein [Candidatus Norongarragalinales archaeon]